MQTRVNAEIVVYSEIQNTKTTDKRLVKNRVQVQIRKSDIAMYKGADRNRKREQRESRTRNQMCG